jgi:hypothetical protein
MRRSAFSYRDRTGRYRFHRRGSRLAYRHHIIRNNDDRNSVRLRAPIEAEGIDPRRRSNGACLASQRRYEALSGHRPLDKYGNSTTVRRKTLHVVNRKVSSYASE